jgi:hypothetical protein
MALPLPNPHSPSVIASPEWTEQDHEFFDGVFSQNENEMAIANLNQDYIASTWNLEADATKKSNGATENSVSVSIPSGFVAVAQILDDDVICRR